MFLERKLLVLFWQCLFSCLLYTSILGNLNDFEPDTDSVSLDKLLPIDKWALMKLDELNDKVREGYESFEFHQVFHAVHNFCVVDMSNFYFDVLKDRLYTEKSDGELRRAAQTTIYIILDAMTRMIAPILAFTSDEIWKYMKHSKNDDAENVVFNSRPEKTGINAEMCIRDRCITSQQNKKIRIFFRIL